MLCKITLCFADYLYPGRQLDKIIYFFWQPHGLVTYVHITLLLFQLKVFYIVLFHEINYITLHYINK